MRKLTIVFHHAGGGHRNAAEALKDTLTVQECPWEVSLLDLQEFLDPLDVFRRATGLRIQDGYNLILRKGWTRATPQLLRVLQGTIWAYHSKIVRALRTYWAQHPADLVLSVIPHFNRELAESLREEDPRIPFVTLVTDLADYPPRFWIEPQSQYIIVGTERGRQQALAMGHPENHIFLLSGMVLKPKFYEKKATDKASERKRIGLNPDLPTGIVLFGGHGSGVMVEIAKKLNAADRELQLIMICGHNQKLAIKLKRLATHQPMLVLGFTTNVEYYMSLSDFFIGKPGPGSISEALQFHLPVIVECNKRTLPQERYNAQWVTEQGFGLVVSDFRQIATAVQRLLDDSTLPQLRLNVSKYSNRSLFEVPTILEKCLNGTV